MKKIILSLLALMSVAGIFAQSQIYVINGIYYRLIQDPDSNNASDLIASVTTMGETDHYQGSISIPSSVTINGKNYNVGAINDMAFKTCKGLTQIVIPASIKHIPNGAFYGCENLTSIVVANGNPVYDSRDNCNAVVETATNTLIAGCKNTSISSNTTGIGEVAFYGCNSLVSINLPYSITSIGKWAFLDCTGLTTVAIPSSITTIETGVFEGCTNLASIDLPASITSIGDNAFRGCINLAIEIPTTITQIGTNSFNGIGTLYWNSNYSPSSLLSITQPSAIVFGDNVTSINYSRAFSNCQRLKSITIPASVTTIHRRAFEGLYNLETINWNANVSLSRIRLIDNSRTTLKTFILGDSVSIFDWFLLIGCTNLETISVAPGNPVYDSRNNCNAIIESVDGNDWYKSDEDQRETDIYYYSEYYHKKKDRMVLGCKNTVIPNTVTSIGEGAFTRCTGLTSIYIPASVKKINSNPFVGCNELSSIIVDPNNTVYDSRGNCNAIIETQTNTLVIGCNNTMIPSDLSRIGGRAFSGCSNLASITIPSSVTFIGGYAFEGCSALKTISIPENITSINDGTFFGCTDLTSIQLSSNVNYLGHEAFSGCCSLSSIVIPTGVTRLNFNVFNACSSLTSIIIPAGVDTILNGAFCGCSDLPSINIPAGVTCIKDYAFASCSSLTSLTLPSGIDFIAPHLIEGCSSLESINIPSGVDSIGEYAFAGCRSLKSITVPEGVTTIYFSSFYNCNSLSYLSLPSTVNNISRSSEYDYNSWNDYLFDHFMGCNELKTAGPKGGGYNYEFDWDTIPANAFRGLHNLRSVYIPQTIKAIYECDVQANTTINNSAYNAPNNDFYGISFNNDCGSVGTVFYGCDSLQSVAVSFKNTKLMRLWRDEEYRDSLSFSESPMDFNLYKLNPVQSITVLDDSINDLSFILTQTIKEVVVSQYVQYVDSTALRSGPQTVTLDRFYYNTDIGLYRPRMFDLASNLERIIVESGNTSYSSFDGVLLNKDGNRLLLCPSKRKDGYSIPETVVTVNAASFKGCKGLKFVNIPSSVEHIGERAFEGCDSIDWIIFEGSPQIGLNAFADCQNIRSVTAHSYIPGFMHLYDSPQTIMPGEYNKIATDNTGLTLTPIYNDSLGRTITEITSNTTNWTCSIKTDAVAGGKYKIFVGVLPNIDLLPNKFSIMIVAYFEDETTQMIYSGRQGSRFTYYTASGTQYDSIFIKEVTIPDGCNTIETVITKPKGVGLSNRMVLDRIFFEPLGDDFPEDAYAGPFTQKVFNNAMLYVPDGAVSTYQASDGWKLFKNIAIDDAVESIRIDKNTIISDDIKIFDSMGRKVEAESIEQLSPGLFIIEGNTYLVK